jgi:predicted transcriptional regulator
MNLPTIPTRKIDSTRAGAMIRAARTKAEISLRRLAVAMGKSAPYLCDLELGRRNWTPELFSCAESKLQELIADKHA